MDPAAPLSLTFRQIEVTRIMGALRAGESCSVVGIGSAGKSNLLRFLQREDVLQAYLGDEWASFLLVYVDGNKLLRPSVWAMVELMLHQLIVTLEERDASQDLLRDLERLHRKSAARKTRYLAVRYLDRAVGAVRRQLGLRLVFLMDECDGFFRTLPDRGFSTLRALRDDHKYNLMYLVATRLEWDRLRQNLSEVEAFEELVSLHTIWLGPYTEDDARTMIQRMEARYGVSLSESATRQILSATGGHPGLLRAAYWVASKHSVEPVIPLASSSRIRTECRRIWHSLTPDEQKTMTILTSGAPVGSQHKRAVGSLIRKGIVNNSGEVGPRIFLGLLAEYVDREKPHIGAELQVDREGRIVWVNGYAVDDLAPLEFELIDYLDQRAGQACSREDLIEHLYPGSQGDMQSEGNALEAVVKRLRQALGPDSDRFRYVQTVRGHGYRLVKNPEQDL